MQINLIRILLSRPYGVESIQTKNWCCGKPLKSLLSLHYIGFICIHECVATVNTDIHILQASHSWQNLNHSCAFFFSFLFLSYTYVLSAYAVNRFSLCVWFILFEYLLMWSPIQMSLRLSYWWFFSRRLTTIKVW